MKKLLLALICLLPIACFGAVANQYHGTFTGNAVGLTNMNWIVTNATLFTGAMNWTNQQNYHMYGGDPSQLNLYGAGGYGGQELFLHKFDNTNCAGIGFVVDRWSTNLGVEYPEVFYLGMDVSVPSATFFAMFDKKMNADVLKVGFSNSIRGHFSFGTGDDGTGIPLDTRVTMKINDNLLHENGTNTETTLQIFSRNTGIRLVSTNDDSDSIVFWQSAYGEGRYLRWASGDYAHDWRMGTDTNTTYDLVIRNTASNTTGKASAPGNEVVRFRYANYPRIITSTAIEEGVSPMTWLQETELPEGLTWSYDGNGWAGIRWTNGVDDMAIHKLGRWSEFGLTNGTKTILLLTLSGGKMITNTSLTVPRTGSKIKQWVWADCYTVIPAGTVCWLVTDLIPGDAYNYITDTYWAWMRNHDTNLVNGTIYGVWTNAVVNGDYLMGSGTGAPEADRNFGPVNYLRY